MFSRTASLVRKCGKAVRLPLLPIMRPFSLTSQTSQSEDAGRSSRYVKTGRFEQLHYETAGTGEHAVLMLPGALGSTSTDFGPQLAKLERSKFTWLALDLPGYGKSQPPEREWKDKFLHQDAEVAREFMRTLDYRSYSLVGWSDGGNVAMILAARYPEVVKKMVVWGSNSYITPEDLHLYDSIADIDKWSAKMRQGYIDVYGEACFRKHWTLWLDAVKAYYHNHHGNLFKELLPLIQCRTLIVHGDKDAMVPLFHPQYLHKHIPDSRLIRWPDGKHNLHLRYADEFNAEVEKFLQES